MTKEEVIAYFTARRNYNHNNVNREAERLALAALRTQQKAENPEPLTLDELREMDGEPVWVEDLVNPEKSCYRLCYWDRGKYFVLISKELYGYLLEDYGEIWLAYRRKPEEG